MGAVTRYLPGLAERELQSVMSSVRSGAHEGSTVISPRRSGRVAWVTCIPGQ